MVIKCLCFDGVKNSENCTFRFRKLYVSFSRLYFWGALVFNLPCGVLRRKYCYWIWSSDARAKEYAPIEIALLAPRDEMATPVDLAGS